MSDAGAPHTYDLLWFEELDSTNSEARRLAEAGKQGPVWIAAGLQTAGRGRRGRAWDSPSGNLMCTLLIRPDCSPAKAAELSFVAGLALHEAALSFMGPAHAESIRLKWPNDLLLNGKKASGILLESATEGPGKVSWLAIGIGLNLATYPEGQEFPATSIAAQTGDAPAPKEALRVLAAAFDKWLKLWQEAQSFAPLRDAWLARAGGLEGIIRARLPEETVTGTFAGLDNDGALRLRLDDGSERAISAGDVFFGTGQDG